jgi:hypothetical protein
MLRNEAPDYYIKENLCSITTLAQCCIELPNLQGSDTTKDDSSNADDYIIISLVLSNLIHSYFTNKKAVQQIEQPFKILKPFKPY